MRPLFVVFFLLPLGAHAQVYKCTDNSGRVAFSDQPCSAEHSGGPVELKTRLPARDRGQVIQSHSGDGLERSLYGQIPALERQAQQAIDSGDPAQAKLGEELMWRAHQQREAIKRVESAKAQQAETNRKYERALREIGR
ncbi:DUF4124 domain-containing protein [Pseudomonas baltica]|uniref:DUF4124 domain-containing protein n=1 Tax=Pseudomonas baltica TaxID=2762576 RepID=A0A7X1KRZ8_9PSED|nr:DUF4124 domain-containing protein [Pseudomonas baltica]MBC2676890.1 DUF4124 domain-containing protein [Pseudomonas baltica]